MIAINLRPGLKRKRGGSMLAGMGERFKGLATQVKDPLLLAAVASLVLTVGWLGYVWVSTARELGRLEPRLEQARAEHQRFKGFLAQKRRQELIRDSLLSQISTIRGVDGDRYVWPHVLDEVSHALPAYTWLVDMGTVAPAATDPKAQDADSGADSTAKTVQVQLTGRTVDIQAYTKFLRQLEASPWFSGVTPVAAQTVVEHERAITAFTIRASFRKADSAYIRTVPLSQSVR
jgi:Tfp pilus assembly protein PilN